MKSFYEENVPYIVHIKERYTSEIENTTLNSKVFCGYLENFYDGRIVFTLIHNQMTVVIPCKWIEFMAPSKVYFDKFRNELSKR